MLKEIKKEITKLSVCSTAYGVPNLFRSEHLFNRVLWIFFLVASTVATCYWVYYGICDYLKYDVVTLVQTVYEQPLEFPTITFCPIPKDNFRNYSLNQIVNGSQFGYDMSIGFDPDNHFETFISQRYGRCYKFNGGKNLSNHSIPMKKATIGGRNDCFKLNLNSATELFIWIHNKSSPPVIQNNNNHDDPIRIAKGTSNYLMIEKTIESKLGEPYSRCINDPTNFRQNKTIIDHILNKNESYSQIKCLELCFDISYIETNPCNCTEAKLGSVWLDCWIQKENESKTGCTYNFKNDFYKKQIVEYCAHYCPLECDTTSYSYTLSVGNDNAMINTLIFIYYRSLKYTSITQEAKILSFDLVSGLGGSLSLFIGISFVSLFEISEVLIGIVFIVMKRNNRFHNENQNDSTVKCHKDLETRIKENEHKLEALSKAIQSFKNERSETALWFDSKSEKL